MKRLILFSLTTWMVGTAAFAQSIPFPQSSPTATVAQNFATSKIELNYSRPSAKGRKVFGEVVPFGKFWRTGANAATTISFGEDVKVNGIDVKAGKYGLVTFPGENEWTVVLTKDLNVNNADAYKQENDAARFTVAPEKLNYLTETFTIDMNNIRNNSCDVMLRWENTQVRFSVTASYDERLTKQIGEVMAKDTRPYYGAANYYFENGKDLNLALKWVNSALESNPKAYWVWLLKAKIQKGLKDYNGALESSAKSMELAKADKDDAYLKNNEKLQEEIRNQMKAEGIKPKKK